MPAPAAPPLLEDRPRRPWREAAETLRETRGLAALWWPGAMLHRALQAAGLGDAVRSADRRVYEDRILGHLARQRPPLDILSIGVRSYTRHYEALLAPHRYRTLDIDPAAAPHGSAQGHATGSVTEVDRHYAPMAFDVVLLNGVFGWGLDRRADVEAALGALHRSLRPGGLLVVGWNDIALRRPFAFGSCAALRDFAPHRFAPFDSPTLALGGVNRHRFEFYARRG